MKNLIIYSSLTGNTKKVAEACHSISSDNWEIKDINESIDVLAYNKIVVATWIDKGTADLKSLKLIKEIQNKKVGFIITLGAYADSNHAKDCITNVSKAFEEGNNQIISHFICQGAVDPKLINWMKSLPADHPHAPNPERIKRWEIASLHPNKEDFENAQIWFNEIINY